MNFFKSKTNGCWACKYLEYYERVCYEDSSPEGYYCDYRDVEGFKTFPCERRLKCHTTSMPEGPKGKEDE